MVYFIKGVIFHDTGKVLKFLKFILGSLLLNLSEGLAVQLVKLLWINVIRKMFSIWTSGSL